MAFFKCVFQYTQVDHGFTEVWYRAADNLQAAANFTNALLTAAINTKNHLTVLRKIRVSDVLNNRSAVVVNVNKTTALGPSNTPDICAASAVITINAPSIGAKRQLWMRGLDDNDILRDNSTGADRPSPQFTNFLNAYLLAFRNNNFQVRALSRLTGSPLVYTPLQSITVAGPGQVTVTVPPGFILTASRRIIISQASPKQFPGLNGHWSVTNATSTTFIIPYNCVLPNGVYALTKGRTRPEEYQYGVMDYNTSDFNRFGTRDTGRNPLGGRGKRSSHLLRSA